MFVKVRIEAPLSGIEDNEEHEHMQMSGGGVLAVPRGSIINTGRRTVAFVEKEPGRYVLREVELGVLAGDHYVVLGGLSEGERVVERGSFLLDSQARLTGQAEEIYGGALGKESVITPRAKVEFTASALRFDAVETNTGNTGAAEIAVYGVPHGP